jgi:putative membrane protein
MKKILFAAMLLSVLGAGCDTKKTDSTTTTTTDDTSRQTMNRSETGPATGMGDTGRSTATTTPVTDAAVNSFVQKALSGGMMKVELGNMASTNAQNQRVKNFGAMMVSDHSQAGNELRSMATSNAITVPSAMMPEHKKHVDMLRDKKGSAFDKAYMDMMVKDHKEDIKAFTNASQNLTEAGYKNYAAKTLPVLQKHLDSAQAIIKSL